MIDIKTAVVKAREYFEECFPENKESIRLEETEMEDNEKYWNITLSYTDYKQKNFAVGVSIFNQNYTDNRVYKLLKVNTNTGIVESMKIRKL